MVGRTFLSGTILFEVTGKNACPTMQVFNRAKKSLSRSEEVAKSLSRTNKKSLSRKVAES